MESWKLSFGFVLYLWMSCYIHSIRNQFYRFPNHKLLPMPHLQPFIIRLQTVRSLAFGFHPVALHLFRTASTSSIHCLHALYYNPPFLPSFTFHQSRARVWSWELNVPIHRVSVRMLELESKFLGGRLVSSGPLWGFLLPNTYRPRLPT